MVEHMEAPTIEDQVEALTERCQVPGIVDNEGAEMPRSVVLLLNTGGIREEGTGGQARRSSDRGRAKDAFKKAASERRRRTTSPVASMGVDWATHCMHIEDDDIRSRGRSGFAPVCAGTDKDGGTTT